MLIQHSQLCIVCRPHHLSTFCFLSLQGCGQKFCFICSQSCPAGGNVQSLLKSSFSQLFFLLVLWIYKALTHYFVSVILVLLLACVILTKIIRLHPPLFVLSFIQQQSIDPQSAHIKSPHLLQSSAASSMVSPYYVLSLIIFSMCPFYFFCSVGFKERN